MTGKVETRAAFEFRAEPDGRTVSGIAIKYGDIARLPFGMERFESGAFTDLADVRLNVQHDRGRIVARVGAGLELTDGPDALRFEALLPATREADDLLTNVRAGVYRGASIEFKAIRERNEAGVRVVSRALLVAVAVVDDPAYADSGIRSRSRQGRSPCRRFWL